MILPQFHFLSFMTGFVIALISTGILFLAIKLLFSRKKKPKFESLMTEIDSTRDNLNKTSESITKLYEILLEIQNA